MNTSATGGYLAPAAVPAPLEDDALTDALQAAVVGITGMDGTLVRPRWQAEPPNLPAFGTSWAAVGVVANRVDTFAWEGHDPTGGGGDGDNIVKLNEELDVMVSFYGPAAENNSNLLRTGFGVAQNREALAALGIFLVKVGGNMRTSELIKERWLPRTDITFTVRREITRVYPVLSILDASGELDTEVETVEFST